MLSSWHDLPVWFPIHKCIINVISIYVYDMSIILYHNVNVCMIIYLTEFAPGHL